MTGIWAVLPIKEIGGAKQRLAGLLTPPQRRMLAITMAEDVLSALTVVRGLAGVMVVTLDAEAAALARRFGARVVEEGALDGHTGAVMGATRVLRREGAAGLLQVPGDIPRITASEVEAVLAAHRPRPSFTIVPAHDERGSNCVVLTPPDSVPLRFGDDSYFPHLDAARAQGIEPTIVSLPGIGMDIDHPVDLARFLHMPPTVETRTLSFLEASGIDRLLVGAPHGTESA